MNFNILPSAISEYHPHEKTGWLCPYWRYEDVKNGFVDKNKWRNTTYSPKILNFKEGKERDIKYFVGPVLKLISNILEIEKFNGAVLIPIPSSKTKTSPDYWDKPSPRWPSKRKNRDDRNTIFCQMLSKENNNLVSRELITRIKEKEEKDRWTAQEHANSMKVNQDLIAQDNNFPHILIDDVRTTGTTLDGAKILLGDFIPNVLIFQLTIGRWESPSLEEL